MRIIQVVLPLWETTLFLSHPPPVNFWLHPEWWNVSAKFHNYMQWNLQRQEEKPLFTNPPMEPSGEVRTEPGRYPCRAGGDDPLGNFGSHFSVLEKV